MRVTSYINPDADGVAGALAYAELANRFGHGQTEAVFAGSVDAETRALLAGLDLPSPRIVDEMSCAAEVVLVDTHHPIQLPAWVDLARVVLIIDHHPDGDGRAFPNAVIQNERVGAACTLIAERFRAAEFAPSTACAGLLQGGILSNTLGFAAPSTHQRDHVIFEWLRQVRPLDPRLVAAMRLARDEALLRTTAESVAADVKLMIANGERIALSQIEAARAGAIADRDDFWPAIEKMRQHHRADHVLVNLVDLELGRSRLAVSTGWVRSLLSERYGLVFDSDTVWAEEIFLRKTHLVPLLMGG